MYCRNSFPSVIGLTFILLFVAACGAPQATSTAIPPTDTPLPTTSSGTVAVDGVELLYVREGSGKPILVVGSAVYYPRAFSPTLREHFELIFVDWRFFVPSYNPPKEELGNVSLDTFVDDLETVRTALGVDNLSVLGHSIHAQIAIGYARKYPQHISHLILVGGTPYALSEWSKEVEDYWNENASDERKAILAHNLEQLQADFNAAPASHSFAIYYRANVPRFFSNPSFDVQELLEGVENGAGLDQLAASLPNRAQVRQALEGLEMPALVVHGRHDYSIPYPVWEELINGLDNITFRLIDESSHNPQMEHPELFDQELISWFESH